MGTKQTWHRPHDKAVYDAEHDRIFGKKEPAKSCQTCGRIFATACTHCNGFDKWVPKQQEKGDAK